MSIYLGRIVAVGMTKNGSPVAAYRVSSRSFPNREAKILGGAVSVMPRPGFEDDLKKNPYISYNCIRIAGDYAVVTNGSQTDPIAEKIISGMSVRDAIALSLLALDYEKDSYNTPRIVAVAPSLGRESGWLGIVRKDALIINEFRLEPGKLFYISTYERNFPDAEKFSDSSFDAENAGELCKFVVDGGEFANFANPVTSAAAMARQNGFELAVGSV